MFFLFKININIVKIEKTKPKDLNSNKLRYIFNKILNRIKEKNVGFFKFKKMRRIRGLWNCGDIIEIDYRHEIVPTIIHEILHDIYENASETWVSTVESKITQTLTSEDIVNILRLTLDKIDLS
jgi:hypothetical protein